MRYPTRQSIGPARKAAQAGYFYVRHHSNMAATFLESSFFHIYFHELWGLAESISKKCEEVFAACPTPKDGGYIKVDPALHSTIASLLGEAANLKKMLAIPEKIGFKETSEQFAFRVERTKVLNEALGYPPLVEISRVEARHSVEHFDQYLDRASLSLKPSDSSESGLALYNMVLSSWKVFDKKSFPLKLYVADERKYFNLELAADLNALSMECADLIARIRTIGAFKDGDGPGGLMVRVAGDA